MNDMIRRDVLLAELEEEYRWFVEHDEVVLANGYCLAMIKAKMVPGVDAVPVVHARWKRHDEDWRHQIAGNECSACGFVLYGPVGSYCPRCGAKMDGGADDAAD